ncbi:MAG: DUF4388 domain-containing protein [Candidatus Obscuribacterales bacterium]|nr:DUF4388 domain-containing protein [Candidatus Obscuribacterales bacterium]
MIEGNLEDISLPGLLQMLAAESTKNYRLRINRGGQHGDIFVCEGHVLVATYGILEGLDALSEFLTWSEGEFVVEKLPSHFKSTIRSNINLNLAEPGCFADQCAFLWESNVGLNTEIVPSRTFGTSEWQDALHVQPLEKEDYAILGWITDGRTMRQALREFQFDLKKTIGILYRLLITRSVEVVRPTAAFSEPSQQHNDFVKLASKELAKHVAEPKKMLSVEFHATDIGGARARPRGTADDTGSGLPQLTPASAEALVAEKKAAVSNDAAKSAPAAKDGAKPPQIDSGKAKEPAKAQAPAASKDASKPPTTDQAKPSEKAKPVELAKSAEQSKRSETESSAKSKEPAASSKIAPEADVKSKTGSESGAAKAAVAEGDESKKQTKKVEAGAVKSPRSTQDLPAIEQESKYDASPPPVEELPPREEKQVLNVVASPAAPPAKAFDERRTDPLPLVSIDIERLLQSTFQITNIGSLALTNTSLDELLKQVLLDVERGKSLLLVLTDSNRSESAVLATYRYCLDRGYIEHNDTVMSLTVDLLIGRLELEQYLLQRRRITGDQLRDMTAIADRQGISLDKLLVAAGYMLPIDMERVKTERERFTQR